MDLPVDYALSVGADNLTVVRFRASEGLSQLYRYDITVATPEPVAESAILGQEAVFTVHVPNAPPRVVHGLVTGVEQLGPMKAGELAARLCVRPLLWRLRRGRGSRIFQQRTAPQMIDAVLGDLPHRWALARTYPIHEYRAQYKESDLSFVERLLAEAGIWYSFEEQDVVFTDTPSLYRAGGVTLYFAQGELAGLTADPRHVQSFTGRTAAEEVATVRKRRRDLRTPGRDLSAIAPPPAPPPPASAAPAAPSATPLPAAQAAPIGELYEHDERPATGLVGDLDKDAEVTLQRERRRLTVARGTTACRELAPGLRFALADHPLESFNVEHVVVAVEASGVQAARAEADEQVYASTFECVPAVVAYRPRPKRARVVQVMETATVVGPAGEEIHTDPYGRVRVQFHWDRDGKRDEKSSCWIPVAQPWAGSGFGAQFMPRVGMDVLVAFIGGDVDQPVITGCLYSGTNVPPYRLPAEQSKSGFRGQSTPKPPQGAGAQRAGANELLFDDKAGAEILGLHAARDLQVTAGHDAALHVRGTYSIHARGGLAQNVDGSADTSMGAERKHVAGAQQLVVGATSSTTVGGNCVTAVACNASTAIKGDYVLQVGGRMFVSAGTDGDRSDQVVGFTVHGPAEVRIGDTLMLRADAGLTLACGESVLELRRDGVRIRAKTIELDAAESAGIASAGTAVELGKEKLQLHGQEVLLLGERSMLRLDRDALVNGDMVRLNSQPAPPPGGRSIKDIEKVRFETKLTDVDHTPYAGKTYHLFAGGYLFRGVTDAEGTVREDVPKDAKALTIKLWLEEYPKGKTRLYSIGTMDLPPATEIRGAQVRLHNLGYYQGKLDGTENGEYIEALKEFQSAAGLAETGKLDEDTVATLGRVHGS
jgi:type VI secretion system secreted protein VgrG